MNSIVKAIILALVFQLASYHTSLAYLPTGEVTWVGDNSSDWNDAGNYSGNWGFLPGNRDRVIINPSYYINAPVIDNAPTFSPASINLDNGAYLTVNNSATTTYMEISGGRNTIQISEGNTLEVTYDLLFDSNNGRVTLNGDGQFEVQRDVVFQNNASRLINNLTKTLVIQGDVFFDAIASWIQNFGDISIDGDLSTGSVLAITNRVENESTATLTINGDINFNGAANTINNYGVINQYGNFIGIDVLCRFDNKSGGTWNWMFTGGTPDPDMLSALIPDGTVVYAGNGAQEVLSVTYNNLKIAGSGLKTLQDNASVSGTLTMESGLLELGDYDLTIGGSGTIQDADASAYIVAVGDGKLVQTGIGADGRTGDILFPIGDGSTYSPVIINNTGDSDVFSVNLGSALYVDGYSGMTQASDAVNKTWFIDEAVEGGSDVAVTLQWDTSDQLSGFSPTAVRLIHYDGTEWETLYEGAASGVGPFTATASNVSSFSPFGIEGENGVLPVELLHFTGKMQGENALLTWATASEINNDHFTIEKTEDLENYVEIGKIKGHGNTSEKKNYEYIDRSVAAGRTYYRLKQTDFDGAFTYSGLVSIENISELNVSELNLYPVPNNGESITLQISDLSTKEAIPITVYNSQGRAVYESKVEFKNNTARLDFAETLPSGVYTIKVETANSFLKQFTVL